MSNYKNITKSFIAGVMLIVLSACVPVNTDNMSACEKEALIMENVVASEYDVLPNWNQANQLPLLTRVFLDLLPGESNETKEYLDVTVSHDKDEFPQPQFLEAPRTRAIHPFGSVAAIEFVARPEQPFDGFFKGAPCGVMRLSLGSAPTAAGIGAGVGVKFLADKSPSVNFVAMFSLSGQEGANFFKHDLSNFLEMPSNFVINILSNVFKLVTGDPFKVDVTHLAEKNQYGPIPTTNTKPDAPVKLILKPNRAQIAFSDAAHEVRNDFETIAPGTVLYNVYGRRKNETQEIYIGDIVSKTKFVSSRYGDEKLFFRHQTVDGRL